MQATFKKRIIAESQQTVVVENNHYFPKESVNMNYLKKSGNHYTCPWKGTCDYYDVIIDNEILRDAAWVYPDPKPAAKEIKERFAFWKGVEVSS